MFQQFGHFFMDIQGTKSNKQLLFNSQGQDTTLWLVGDPPWLGQLLGFRHFLYRFSLQCTSWY